MDFIFIHQKHRQNQLLKPNYESFEEYCKRLEREYNLVFTPFHHFKRRTMLLKCFEVKDKVKGLEFVFKYPEYIEKPEKE